MIEHDLVPFLLDKDSVDIESLYDEMQWHLHYVVRGGIASFAISAVDIALWDIRCKRAGGPLWKIVGGKSDRCKGYRGGIDLNYSLPKLLDSVQGYLDEGFNGVKIKVGKEDLNEDLERARAVRELIGPDIDFMVDANYALDLEKAKVAARGFQEFDIVWFEEPTIPDDYKGFGLADAGVEFSAIRPATLLVLLGLIVGKPLGILFMGWLAAKPLGFGLPKGMRVSDLLQLDAWLQLVSLSLSFLRLSPSRLVQFRCRQNGCAL